MRRFGLLSLAQRIVLVVALGVGLVVFGQFVIRVGGGTSADFGWFGYAPLTSSPQSSGWPAWAILVAWLAVIVAWAVASLLLLRPAREHRD
jgi:heme/copper-type cytochrome/quinol oxidase subunit 1